MKSTTSRTQRRGRSTRNPEATLKRATTAIFRRDPTLRRIVEVFRAAGAQAIVLFGSRARGDATPASDYDVVVVMRRCRRNYVDRLLDLGPAVRRVGRPMNLIVYTPAEFRQVLRDSVFGDILKADGILLYEGDGSASLVSDSRR